MCLYFCSLINSFCFLLSLGRLEEHKDASLWGWCGLDETPRQYLAPDLHFPGVFGYAVCWACVQVSTFFLSFFLLYRLVDIDFFFFFFYFLFFSFLLFLLACKNYLLWRKYVTVIVLYLVKDKQVVYFSSSYFIVDLYLMASVIQYISIDDFDVCISVLLLSARAWS